MTHDNAIAGLSQNLRNRVLAINPGSTSTKFGLYTRQGAQWVRTVRHGDEELSRFGDRPMVARLEYRAAMIGQALEQQAYVAEQVAAVAGRGGLLPPVACGTYLVDDAMVEELRLARRGEHASNLGALLALRFAHAAGVNAYIVDPVTADEWQDCARLSGLPLIERSPIGHVLNTRAVAHRFAREQGRPYESLRLIVAHMGSGITVSAHQDGRQIDSNTIEEGPFGPDRTGGLPVRALIKLCFSGRFAQKEIDHKVFGNGGLFAYLGTRDLEEVVRRIDSGDREAGLVFEAMIYQIAKEAGAMAAILEGRVDALLLSGGMAYSKRLISRLREYLEWIAPLTVYPGEDELQALAEGVFRVLDGVEKAKRLSEEVHKPAQASKPREPLVLGIE
jgi:butyrate kinase